VSSEKSCSLEPIPDFINPEDMSSENRRSIDVRQLKEVKYYQVRSDPRKATDEEKDALTDSMKSECAGKNVIISSVETIDEDELLARSIANISNNFRRVGRQGVGRQGFCNNLVYACTVPGAGSSCFRWTFGGLGTTSSGPGAQPLIYHLYSGLESYCTRCCPEQGSAFVPCSCITNAQAFSTSFAIARAATDPFNAATMLDCIKRSAYCKWDRSQQLPNNGCSYTTQGSCVNDGCPLSCSSQVECNDDYGVMPPLSE